MSSGCSLVRALCIAALSLIQSSTCAGPTYEVVSTWGDIGPTHPLTSASKFYSALLPAPNGYFYGVSGGGGVYGFGCVYRVSSAGDITPVISFTGASGPYPGSGGGGLVLGPDGNIYGTTRGNGSSIFGSIFRLSLNGSFTSLVQFDFYGVSGVAGDRPSPLVLGRDGNFYGVTRDSQASNYGSFFRLTPAGFYTELATFPDSSGTKAPNSPLVEGPVDGVFYGTSDLGGNGNNGTVFRIALDGTRTAWSIPHATSLTLGSDGAFYGTRGYYNEIIFKMTPEGTNLLELDLTASPDLLYLCSPLTQGSDGNYYGVYGYGGSYKLGATFRITPEGVLTKLADFSNGVVSGETPATLVIGEDGNFYGTTVRGGNNSSGTIFRMTSAGALTTLANFTFDGLGATGGFPYAGLVQDSSGTIYGSTYSGGAFGWGTIFKLAPASGVRTKLVDFTGAATSPRGANPYARLTLGSDGNLYGSTLINKLNEIGSGPGNGSIFRMSPTGAVTTLVEFTGTTDSFKGTQPYGGLLQDSDGSFYGTTYSGGLAPSGAFNPGNFGTIFKMSPAGALQTLVELNPNIGANPYGTLVKGSNGNFYGTTSTGGTSNRGTVFTMTPSGVLTTLVSFTGTTGARLGSTPSAGLALGSDGNFYGTASAGGASDNGIIFKMTPAGEFQTLVEFTNNGSSNKGRYPTGALVEDSNNNFFGTTREGGASGKGTIFQMTPDGVLTTLVEFTGVEGAAPGALPKEAAILRGIDGNLYGTASAGGPGESGVIWRLRYGPSPFTLSADTITPNTATLRGTVNPNGEATTVFYEYGIDPALAGTSQTAPTGIGNSTAPLNVTQNINGLAPNTVYYFRAVASNATGTQRGQILSFPTGGPAEMWLFKHFGEDWQNISLAADSDGDGRPNLAEYAFGSDPGVADSPMLPSVVNAGGYLVLTFSRNIANTDLTYIVQGSNNLTAWTDLASCTGSAATVGLVGGVAVEESGVGEFITVQVTDFAPAGGPTATRFLRVRLVK